MDSMLMGAPATKPRRPIDITTLPPEMQSQLAAGQPVRFEDGSNIYPDGTTDGAGDSPGDYAVPPATGGGFTGDFGGYADRQAMGGGMGGGMMAGAPAPMVEERPAPTYADPTAMGAAMPGNNPMREPTPGADLLAGMPGTTLPEERLPANIAVPGGASIAGDAVRAATTVPGSMNFMGNTKPDVSRYGGRVGRRQLQPMTRRHIPTLSNAVPRHR